MFKQINLNTFPQFLSFFVGIEKPAPALINQNAQVEEHLFSIADFCVQQNVHFEHVMFETLVHIPQETPDFLKRADKAKEQGKKVILAFTGVDSTSIASQNLIFKNQMPFNTIPEEFYCAYFSNFFVSTNDDSINVLLNHSALT